MRTREPLEMWEFSKKTVLNEVGSCLTKVPNTASNVQPTVENTEGCVVVWGVSGPSKPDLSTMKNKKNII